MEGYKRALAQAGIKVIEDYIVKQRKGDVGSKQEDAEAMRQLLSLKPLPGWLFCFNDPLAMEGKYSQSGAAKRARSSFGEREF